MINNYTLLLDFYELTMANGYLNTDFKNDKVYFDIFFRKVPDNGGFAIFSGLETIIDYINNLKFTDSDLDYLRSKKIFSEEFLTYLKNFKFEGDIYSVKEGTPIFPYEPVMVVRGNPLEAQLLETFILLSFNHQSLIATKANRIKRAAGDRSVMEFGARRAQGKDAALYGARAAYIGGVNTTSNVLADINFNIKAVGTMAHSWVQMFDSEYESFCKYIEVYPENPVLLIDTYNVLKKGLPNAIKAFKKYNITSGGVRIDSGDIAYLTKRIRQILDNNDLKGIKIVVSNSLDEYLIRDLLLQGAQIDSFGVGERLITSKSEPVFGGVYKLAAIEKDNKIIPKIKVSENPEKVTTPHFKKVYRFYDKNTNKAIADLLTIYDEKIPDDNLEIFDPIHTWKKKTITNYYYEDLLKPIFKNGKLVYKLPNLKDIQSYCLKEIDNLWDEVKRFENPHNYYVDLSQRLWDLKNDMIEKYSK